MEGGVWNVSLVMPSISHPKHRKEEKYMLVISELLEKLYDLKKIDHMKVKKNNTPKSDASIEKAIKLLESAKRKRRKTDDMSGGERKRPSIVFRKSDCESVSIKGCPTKTVNIDEEGGGNCQVFVGDLSPMISLEETRRQMEAAFSKYGQILSIRILWGKKYGFIVFATHQQAQAAIYGMNRKELGNVPVYVSWGKERYS